VSYKIVVNSQYTQHINASGGIISTSGDMAKYMIAVIDAFNDKEGAKLSK